MTMTTSTDDSLAASEWPEIVRQVRARTPARLLEGRAGAAYRTRTQMELREAHAAARDAVRAELDMQTAWGMDVIRQWRLFEVSTRARNKDEYLLRPDLGRHFDDAARVEIRKSCASDVDFQIAIGDGLSVAAVTKQVPLLLPLVYESAVKCGWSVGRTFVIRHCRVGILNEIGELLRPAIVVLLIGERPGLATAESLSAYLAYRPDSTNTDANRNLVSNIHARGLSAADAAQRITHSAKQMMTQKISGCRLKLDTGDSDSSLNAETMRLPEGSK